MKAEGRARTGGGRPNAVKALGEVALRVNDLGRMKRFYEEVLGLEVLEELESAALLRIAEGYGGHTRVLGLFDRSMPVGPARTTLDHLAFAMAGRITRRRRRGWRAASG